MPSDCASATRLCCPASRKTSRRRRRCWRRTVRPTIFSDPAPTPQANLWCRRCANVTSKAQLLGTDSLALVGFAAEQDEAPMADLDPPAFHRRHVHRRAFIRTRRQQRRPAVLDDYAAITGRSIWAPFTPATARWPLPKPCDACQHRFRTMLPGLRNAVRSSSRP